MNIIISGIQGSGKGTQSKLIAEKYGLKHISIGDCIYKYLNENPEFVYPYTLENYKSGFLAPNDVVIKVTKNEVENAVDGFILDGYPRQLEQLHAISTFNVKFDKVIVLDLTEEQCFNRLIARGRADDTLAGIDSRIQSYNKFTYPVIMQLDAIANIAHFDASQSIDVVFAEICKELDKYLLVSEIFSEK